MLIVFGSESSFIKQVWLDSEYTDYSEYSFIRTYSNSAWSSWKHVSGNYKKSSPGYYKMPSGLIIQWGYIASTSTKQVTYPIAFPNRVVVVFQKKGYASSDSTTDMGFTEQLLTGFTMNTSGGYEGINWIAIGY